MNVCETASARPVACVWVEGMDCLPWKRGCSCRAHWRSCSLSSLMPVTLKSSPPMAAVRDCHPRPLVMRSALSLITVCACTASTCAGNPKSPRGNRRTGSSMNRSGPYRVWITSTHLQKAKAAARCGIFVRYAAPGGWLVDRLFVRHDVRRIFEYRTGSCRSSCLEDVEGVMRFKLRYVTLS